MLFRSHQNFKDYWGIRLANSIRAFHLLIYSNADFDNQKGVVTPEEDTKTDTENWIITQRQRQMDNNEL